MNFYRSGKIARQDIVERRQWAMPWTHHFGVQTSMGSTLRVGVADSIMLSNPQSINIIPSNWKEYKIYESSMAKRNENDIYLTTWLLPSTPSRTSFWNINWSLEAVLLEVEAWAQERKAWKFLEGIPWSTASMPIVVTWPETVVQLRVLYIAPFLIYLFIYDCFFSTQRLIT